MSFSAEQLTYIESWDSAGWTLRDKRPHPLLQKLLDAAEANDFPAVQSTLSELGPFPSGADPVATHCIAKALLAATKTPAAAEGNNGPHRPLLQAMLDHPGLAVSYACTNLAIDHALKQQDLPALQAFVSAGWDVNEAGPGTYRRPALRLALLSDSGAVRAWLLACGADPNIEDEHRVSSLEAAARGWAAVGVMRELLAHGADPGRSGDESMVLAARLGDVERAGILVAAGADVDGREKEGREGDRQPHRKGRTALIWAVRARKLDMVRWLVDRGAQVGLKDELGKTALDVARTMKEDEIAAVLGG